MAAIAASAMMICGIASTGADSTWTRADVVGIIGDVVYVVAHGDLYSYYADDITYGAGTQIMVQMSNNDQITDAMLIED